jgi:hypothetical protein
MAAPPIRGWGVGTGPDFKKEKMQKRNRELDLTAWLGMEDSKCAGRPARSRWCKSTTMKE